MRDWVTAGLVGAVLSGAPSGLLALLAGDNVLDSTAAIATTVLPEDAPRPVLVGAGVAGHVAISLAWAAALRRLLGPRPRMAVGAAAGLAIAALDLGVIGRRLPSIQRLAVGPQILDHLAYGGVVAFTLRRLAGGTA